LEFDRSEMGMQFRTRVWLADCSAYTRRNTPDKDSCAMERCPGGELRNLTVAELTCRHCGTRVELFSDEQRRKCPECGRWVAREAAPTCASWCASAEACLGAERYGELVRSGMLGESPDGDDTAED